MSATSGMTITITNSSGQELISNDLKFSSGVITKEEDLVDAPKVIKKTVQILSTDYGITGFNDKLTLDSKITVLMNKIEELNTEFKNVKKVYDNNTKYLTIDLNILKTYQDKVNNDPSDTEAQKQLDSYTADIKKTESYISENKERLSELQDEIDMYTAFLEDLETNGETKTVETLESVGEQESEEVDLDNLDLASAPGMGISGAVTEAVAAYLETTMQSLIAGGAMNLLNSMGLNQENLNMALQIVDLLDNSVMKISCIIPFIPKNIEMVPHPKYCLNLILTSLKDMFLAMYNKVEVTFHETYDEALTNLPNTEEILADAQLLAISTAETMLDEQCVKYTGHTSVELYYMCADYIAKYKAWKKKRKEEREAKKEQEALEAETGVYTSSGSTTNRSLDINVNVDADQLKDEFIGMLMSSSDLIYNSFFIIQLRDAFETIKELIQQFHNIDLQVLADNINSLDDLITLLQELGIDDTNPAMTISLEDAIKSGLNEFASNLNNLKDSMEAQALAIGMETATSVASQLKNTKINTTNTKVYDFAIDTNTGDVTLNIYADPTIKKNLKNITNALTNTKKADKTNIFDSNDVATILNYIKKGYADQEDLEFALTNYSFKIHFDDKVFNSGATTEEELKSEIEAVEELNNTKDVYELGIVEEEYTLDPTQAAKRPTLDLIKVILNVLNTVFPAMKTLATLVSNYKTNKARAAELAEGNIFYMISTLAKLYNLLKKTNTDQLNFYTIRSLKLYTYVTEHIQAPNGDEASMLLDLSNTRVLYLYLKANNLSYSGINLKLETVVYFDYDSINEQKDEIADELNKAGNYFGDDANLFINYPDPKYADGNLDGLDKVQVAGNNIYYTDSSLPLYGSQILRCFEKGYDETI